ncbi:hypothetical protein JXB37_06700 [candidate division WOR-3 bacterium]|nr:hypothetical protein [candidate division WOR-3 bacterium]
MNDEASLVALSTEIGRGHPAYVDSVLAELNRQRPTLAREVERLAVEDVVTGAARTAWRLARRAYQLGASGGAATGAYNRLRGSGPPSAAQQRLLGAALRERFRDFNGICLVEHPLTAAILAPVCRVAYLHAEIAAPAVAAVPGTWRTFVPLAETAERLAAAGVERDALSVTGLVVEPALVETAEAGYASRVARLETRKPLAVGFFVSGAWPRPHLDRIVTAAESVVAAGHRALVFAGPDPRRTERLGTRLSLITTVSLSNPHRSSRAPGPSDPLVLVTSRDRAEETANAALLLPSLDAFVAAAHERTNWAVGLGLPLFALLPHIGPFAPLNFDFAREHGCCLPLATVADAALLDDRLDELRESGELARMAAVGWHRLPIDGAARIALEIAGAVEPPAAGSFVIRHSSFVIVRGPVDRTRPWFEAVHSAFKQNVARIGRAPGEDAVALEDLLPADPDAARVRAQVDADLAGKLERLGPLAESVDRLFELLRDSCSHPSNLYTEVHWLPVDPESAEP